MLSALTHAPPYVEQIAWHVSRVLAVYENRHVVAVSPQSLYCGAAPKIAVQAAPASVPPPVPGVPPLAGTPPVEGAPPVATPPPVPAPPPAAPVPDAPPVPPLPPAAPPPPLPASPTPPVPPDALAPPVAWPPPDATLASPAAPPPSLPPSDEAPPFDEAPPLDVGSPLKSNSEKSCVQLGTASARNRTAASEAMRLGNGRPLPGTHVAFRTGMTGVVHRATPREARLPRWSSTALARHVRLRAGDAAPDFSGDPQAKLESQRSIPVLGPMVLTPCFAGWGIRLAGADGMALVGRPFDRSTRSGTCRNSGQP